MRSSLLERSSQMIILLWAGHDTTSTITTRMLQLLGSAESHVARDALLRELSSTPVSVEGSRGRESPGPCKGILAPFPVLSSIMLETFRWACCPPPLPVVGYMAGVMVMEYIDVN